MKFKKRYFLEILTNWSENYTILKQIFDYIMHKQQMTKKTVTKIILSNCQLFTVKKVMLPIINLKCFNTIFIVQNVL